jgi:DNA modification methylase
MYKNLTGRYVPEQVEAFCDTWKLDAEKVEIAKSMPALLRDNGIDDFYVEFWRLWMKGLRDTEEEILAYLIYMVQRLLYMKLILKPTGSIYLHCDPHASHYIKIMMDAIFGHENFQSEIVWKRTSAHSGANKYGPIHDTILFYAMTDTYTWNPVYQPYTEKHISSSYRYTDENGRRYSAVDLTGSGISEGDSGKPWRGIDPTSKGRHWAPPRQFPGSKNMPIYTIAALDFLDSVGRVHWSKNGIPRFKRYFDETEGMAAQDIITEIPPISSHSKERLGYPTQKPINLLKHFISASTNPGDVVFDPFCGCGTSIYAAHELNREWIGCDVAILAVGLIEKLLNDWYGLVCETAYETSGIPNSVEAAQRLFQASPRNFESWVCELLQACPTPASGDRGIDGRLYFEEDRDDHMIISVKGGNIQPRDIRDLQGARSLSSAQLAGFVSLKSPTKGMTKEAISAGVWEHGGVTYPRIQMLTIQEILEEKKAFQMPKYLTAKDRESQELLRLRVS